MKKILVAVSLMTLASTAFAAKDCGELKNEIAAKLDAKGVAHYSLEIVDKGASADGEVVGTCGGDTKEIVYKRG